MISEFGRFVLGVPIILLIIANAIGQSEYVQYVSKEISFSSNNFLCWFTQAWLIVSLPVGILCDIVFHLVTCKTPEVKHVDQYDEIGSSKKFSLSLYFTHLHQKIRENPNFSWSVYRP